MFADRHPLFRPPAEADSVILRVSVGCPWNTCAFCGMYKTAKYQERPISDIARDIRTESRQNPSAMRVFLADGDPMRLSFETLREVLLHLHAAFPALARVNAYANGRSILAKSPAELAELKRLKFDTLYMGLESGDETVLRSVRKPETAEEMVRAGILARNSGLKMSVMILIGLAGPESSTHHALATAAALNRMQPRLLSALRVIPVPGTQLATDAVAGRFRMLTEHEAVVELREILAALELEGTVFRSDHVSNVVPLRGRLPRDKAAMLAALDVLLASGRLDTSSPGPIPTWL